MSFWGWLILIIVVLALLGGNSNSGKKRRPSGKTKKPQKSAQEIASEVTTFQQFRALERRLENAEDRVCETGSESASRKYELLQEAVSIAAQKNYRWQYLPDICIETPLKQLQQAYKVFPASEFEKAKTVLGGYSQDWVGIDGHGEPEDKQDDDDLKHAISFRKIVEGEFNKEEQIKKINQLTKRNKDYWEMHFDFDDELSPGQQWFDVETS